jgi:predicted porin
VQGVSLVYGGTKTDVFRGELAYHDGANSRNTNFQDGTTNWGAGVRGEYKAFGDWANYKDLTAKGDKENLLVIGTGADYTDRDGANVLLATVDAQYELADRLAVYGAVHGAYTDPHEATGNDSTFNWGVLGQVGYLVSKQWEVFGRYDVVKLDEDAVASGAEDTFHEFTAGVNYYLGKDGVYLHRAKLTLDVGYLPNGAPSDQTQAGILAATDDEFYVRAQFQLLL